MAQEHAAPDEAVVRPLLQRPDQGDGTLAPIGAAGARKLTLTNIKNIALVVTHASKPTF